MNKSEFYKKWYTEARDPAVQLNSDGYPPCGHLGKEITTEEQWTRFLQDELELDVFKRLDEKACEIMGETYSKPYTMSREYADLGDQLDQLYHDIDDGKLGADAKTGSWYLAVKKVKDDFPKN
tara:strand:- start:605 stop:973 length:369 start_codon:yes stop_codon:yes gene_type:complete